MSRPSAPALPPEAREHAWRSLWQRLLQPVPEASPAPDPCEHPNDETTVEDEESAA
jgi:hypothetical protein